MQSAVAFKINNWRKSFAPIKKKRDVLRSLFTSSGKVRIIEQLLAQTWLKSSRPYDLYKNYLGKSHQSVQSLLPTIEMVFFSLSFKRQNKFTLVRKCLIAKLRRAQNAAQLKLTGETTRVPVRQIPRCVPV